MSMVLVRERDRFGGCRHCTAMGGTDEYENIAVIDEADVEAFKKELEGREYPYDMDEIEIVKIENWRAS